MVIRWGACGHPLHPTKGCRVCASAEGTAEALNKLALRRQPSRSIAVRVTRVTGGRINVETDDGERDAFDVDEAYAATFREGEAIEFVDMSRDRADAWEQWAPYKSDTNRWRFFVEREELVEIFAVDREAARWLGFEGMRLHGGLVRRQRSDDITLDERYEIAVDDGGGHVAVDHVMRLRRARARRDGDSSAALEMRRRDHIAEVERTIARLCPPISRLDVTLIVAMLAPLHGTPRFIPSSLTEDDDDDGEYDGDGRMGG